MLKKHKPTESLASNARKSSSSYQQTTKDRQETILFIVYLSFKAVTVVVVVTFLTGHDKAVPV